MSTLIAADTLRPARIDTHTLQVDSVGLVEVTVTIPASTDKVHLGRPSRVKLTGRAALQEACFPAEG
jgi:hypothetical protein